MELIKVNSKDAKALNETIIEVEALEELYKNAVKSDISPDKL